MPFCNIDLKNVISLFQLGATRSYQKYFEVTTCIIFAARAGIKLQWNTSNRTPEFSPFQSQTGFTLKAAFDEKQKQNRHDILDSQRHIL